MRELTEEELKLAPAWETHYYAFDNGTIQYESADLYVRFFKTTGRFGVEQCNKEYGIAGVAIPRKPFDITKHEFGDTAWPVNEINPEQGYVEFFNQDTVTSDGDYDGHTIYKDDAIAVAKALGVTWDDLK